MKAYVGVDWSATEVACSVAIGDGAIRRIKGAQRTLDGVEELVQRIRASCREEVELHVIIEAGAPGWVEMFHHAGAVVHIVDPKQAKAWARSVGSSGAKDDGRDSDHLVGIGRSPDHAPGIWQPATELQDQLDVLGSMHETFTQECTAAQQRLRGLLREQFPMLEAVIEDLTRGWVLALLRVVPTIWHAERVSDADIAKAMSGSRQATRAKVLEVVRGSRAPWLTEGRARVNAMNIHQLLDQMELLCRQLAAIEAEVDVLTKDLDLRRRLEDVDGIGLKMAHRLLQFAFAEVPTNRDEAGIRLGACPVFRGSGKTPKGRPKGKAVMRRAADPRARATTYLLGRLASLQLPWAGRMYADGRKRGQSAATAYRRVTRSLLRILTAMVRTGEPYDEARYVASLKTKGVSWALERAA